MYCAKIKVSVCRYIDVYVCEQLHGANLSPIVANFVSYTLGHRERSDLILEGQDQRSRSGGGMRSTEPFYFFCFAKRPIATGDFLILWPQTGEDL